jgi:hypothetical protein
MGLDEFIKLTLSQIIKAVEEARAESQGMIAPKIGKGYDDSKIMRSDATHGGRGVFLAEFDVALMTSDNSEKAGSTGSGVHVATLDGKKKATSRVRSTGSSFQSRFHMRLPNSGHEELVRLQKSCEKGEGR